MRQHCANISRRTLVPHRAEQGQCDKPALQLCASPNINLADRLWILNTLLSVVFGFPYVASNGATPNASLKSYRLLYNIPEEVRRSISSSPKIPWLHWLSSPSMDFLLDRGDSTAWVACGFSVSYPWSKLFHYTQCHQKSPAKAARHSSPEL